MKTIFLTSYLFVAGLIIALVGMYMSVSTHSYMEAMTPEGLKLSIDLLSDIRGLGGLLLALGAYLLIATFLREEWRYSAVHIAITVCMSFVLFRTLGFFVDGLPGMKIILAYLIEIVLAAWGYMVLKLLPTSRAAY